jgi:hypothetical protein
MLSCMLCECPPTSLQVRDLDDMLRFCCRLAAPAAKQMPGEAEHNLRASLEGGGVHNTSSRGGGLDAQSLLQLSGALAHHVGNAADDALRHLPALRMY